MKFQVSVNQLSVLCLLVLLVPHGLAQKINPDDPKNIEKGKQLIQRTVELRGGAKYLSFTTLRATGQYTPFQQGSSTVPKAFTDYIVYPDRERVDFGKGKMKDRTILVNTGKTGWIYDGDAQTIKDQTDKQITSFQEGLFFDLDRILRGGWKETGVKVWYNGRAETRPGERTDVVAIQLPGERQVLLQFDPVSNLPSRITYEKEDEQGRGRFEVRFYQYVPYGGVKFPNIVDFFRDGVQTARINYADVQLNVPVEEPLFVKPDNIKAVK